jgi:hypothetical protein
MGMLADYFEVMDSPDGGSVCFRVRRAVPPKALAAGFWRDRDAARHLANARAALPDWHGLCVELAQAHHSVRMGEMGDARSILDEVLRHELYDESKVGYDVELVKRAIWSAGRPWRDRLADRIVERLRGWR